MLIIGAMVLLAALAAFFLVLACFVAARAHAEQADTSLEDLLLGVPDDGVSEREE